MEALRLTSSPISGSFSKRKIHQAIYFCTDALVKHTQCISLIFFVWKNKNTHTHSRGFDRCVYQPLPHSSLQRRQRHLTTRKHAGAGALCCHGDQQAHLLPTAPAIKKKKINRFKKAEKHNVSGGGFTKWDGSQGWDAHDGENVYKLSDCITWCFRGAAKTEDFSFSKKIFRFQCIRFIIKNNVHIIT